MTWNSPYIRCLPIAAVLACGCNLLIPFGVLTNPKEEVAPEFDKLPGTRTLVVVWADAATLFDYPHVRFELASYVRDKLAAEVADVDLVNPVRVADYQERTLDASADPVAMGREFDADMVVYLELLKFQIRDPQAPDYLRAEIEASVTVYDLLADPDEPGTYRLEPVEVRYPEQGGVLFSASHSGQVRQGAYVLFAETVARKFYTYQRDL
jgi:hypothetical protein